MRILTYHKGLTEAEWLEIRRQGIGGSDAAAIVGMNPWKSSFGVYLDKIGEAPPLEPTERMQIGKDLEDYVAQKFTEKTGIKVQRRNAVLQHDDYDFILANVDRMVVGKDEGLECKVTNSFSRTDWDGDKIPVHYELQCHHYMLVTGYKAWWIAALIGNEKVIYKRIERDKEIIDWLLEQEKNFWNNHVEARKEPAPDGSPDVDDYLKSKYPEADKDRSVEIHGFGDKLDRRSDIDQLMRQLKTEKDQIEQEIKLEMGEAEKAFADNYSIKWSTVVSNRPDTKAIQRDYPKMYEDYLKPSVSRRFTVKEL